ncbi:hypothetical protein [Kitasatospora cineracea]|uniref:hypothetical protein n=1 Tax=Kitasatospora cineracea TaxID=88074 RepID=UPI001FCA4898|nr:hypothetical protein [Kitasatospora cineracea]
MSTEADTNGESWQSVDSGYEGEQRRIIVYRGAPEDLRARRQAYERLQQSPQD